MRLTLLVFGLVTSTLWSAATATAATQPNLLVIFTDDQTFRAIGYNDPQVQTPHLDALAKRGLIFDNAYVASPICAASRASMMSGVFPQQHGVIALKYREFRAYQAGGTRSDQTLAHQLNLAGYHTGFYGKSHLGAPTSYGFAAGDERGAYDDKPTFEKAAAYLDVQATNAKPFFLWLAPRQPHVPLLPEQRWLDLYPEGKLALPENYRLEPRQSSLNNQGIPGQHFYRDSNYRRNHRDLPAGPPRDVKTMREFIRAYFAVISHLDHQIGQIVAKLRSLGVLENTVIVFLSDNGYHLGSHGLGNKITMHEESARVPMFIVGPGVPSGVRTSALVSSLDVYPTLLQLAGVRDLPEHLMGRSLVPILKDPQAEVRTIVFSECVGVGGTVGQGHRMARTKQWKYILTGTDEQYLFDQQKDPFELRNRIDTPELKPIADELRRELSTWMQQVGDRKSLDVRE
ncbi:MAG: sulfatase-like hydrolase/transferase [Planctomycetes bacterium]|nr:sulfatase-like hydrolase/transferase [Planctomycetota bacterium]MBL7040542.1 sulfatase-like hydrolase/transferase [Pirellulaceae bacterium]